MKHIASIAALLVGLGPTNPIEAADIKRLDPQGISGPVKVSRDAYHWTSYFFGGNAGIVWGTDRGYSIFPNDPAPYRDRSERRAFLAGVQVGLNHQFDSGIVAGIETDLAAVDTDGRGLSANGRPAQTYEWLSTVRFRTGYAFDRFLPYATAGVAFAGSRERGFGFPGSGPSNDRETAVGLVAGAGIEYAMTDDLTFRGEYIHARFGGTASSTQTTSGGVPAFTSHEPRMNLIRFGLSYTLR